MQRSSRAPVLSATLSRVSGWTIGLPGPLQDLDEAPALGARQRPALDHADAVALVRVVLLVVRVQRRRLADDLLVHLVATRGLDAHGDRLVRLGGGDDALAGARPSWAVLLRRRGLGRARVARRHGRLGLLPAAAARLRVAAPALLALGDMLLDCLPIRHWPSPRA